MLYISIKLVVICDLANPETSSLEPSSPWQYVNNPHLGARLVRGRREVKQPPYCTYMWLVVGSEEDNRFINRPV